MLGSASNKFARLGQVLEKIQHGRVTQASCHSDLLREWQAAVSLVLPLWAWGSFHHISAAMCPLCCRQTQLELVVFLFATGMAGR